MWQTILTHTPLLYVTQSFWRDEAFSVLASEQSLRFIITKLGFEPPVYYTLLHFWIRVFGESDFSARFLSLLGYLLTTWLVIKWSAKIYKKHWLSVYLPVFFFLNPMLLYYAFEVRTYAWYTFFSVLMLYGYAQKRWRLFIIAAVLGFYTHVYLLPFIGALFIHWLITAKPNIKLLASHLKQDKALQSFLGIGVLITPWLIRIALEASRLKSSWYFPVNLQLVLSALGNMFTGYEGTPWYGWHYTAWLSLAIAGLALYGLKDEKRRKQTSLFILFGVIPLIVIIGISFIKPLFVNRYLIPSTVAEVFVIVAAIAAIKNQLLQKIVAALLLVFVLWFNWWFPPQHPKPDMRGTLEQVNALAKPSDIILADDALIYLETLYYAKDRSKVYLYNPQNVPFAWYIGDALAEPSHMVQDYPIYPSRAYFVHSDTTFDIVYRIPITEQKAVKKSP
jgi:uncharacterized membrane protein